MVDPDIYNGLPPTGELLSALADCPLFGYTRGSYDQLTEFFHQLSGINLEPIAVRLIDDQILVDDQEQLINLRLIGIDHLNSSEPFTPFEQWRVHYFGSVPKSSGIALPSDINQASLGLLMQMSAILFRTICGQRDKLIDNLIVAVTRELADETNIISRIALIRCFRLIGLPLPIMKQRHSALTELLSWLQQTNTVYNPIHPEPIWGVNHTVIMSYIREHNLELMSRLTDEQRTVTNRMTDSEKIKWLSTNWDRIIEQ
jgi:hypothetical protein